MRLFIISNRRPIPQAGRRGFDPVSRSWFQEFSATPILAVSVCFQKEWTSLGFVAITGSAMGSCNGFNIRRVVCFK
jgi:hypothetical protein